LSNSAVFGFKKSISKYLALIDADLQHPPEMIEIMLNKLKKQQADIIIASKYLKDSQLKTSLSRKFLSKGFIYLSYICFPSIIKIKDPSSGFFVFKKEIIENKELKPLGFRTLLEILVRCKPEKIIEIPYSFDARKAGKSKANVKQIKLHLLHLKKLRFEK
jgi:dolichol-phosphate mannosyltransferase